MLIEQAVPPKLLFMTGQSEDESGIRDASGSVQTARGLKPRVIIVEDEALVALNIEGALSDAGFHVLGVFDTETEAVLAAGRMQPDAVLLDITLREGNGISAAQKIKQMVDTKIVFISGNSDLRTLAAANDVSPAAFIRKPFITETLVKTVTEAVARKH